MNMTTQVIITGSQGRMGQTLMARANELNGFSLVGATEHEASPALGKTILPEVNITSNLGELITQLKNKNIKPIIIDFTLPEPTLNHIKIAEKHKTPIVIGTTGFTEEEKKQIQSASKTIPIVLAPNMSVGVNTLFKLIADATKILGEGYDLEVIEAHHRLKKDSPSGTAVRIGEILAESSGRKYPDDANFHREGFIGERTDKEIGMQTIRGGDIVGDHTVMYCGTGERLEIKHIATSRATFADGALRAAKWLEDKSQGLFDMQDVLGISK